MEMTDFNAPKDMNAIDGVLSDLSRLGGRPRGYPFSKITLYSVEPYYTWVRAFYSTYNGVKVNHVSASDLSEMKRIDFKKAGKVFGKEVQKMKDNLESVPKEYLVIAERFEPFDNFYEKTTACRKYKIVVERDEMPERWLATQVRKAIKKYITEDLDIHITPTVFGDKYPEPNREAVGYVYVTLGNCSEAVYQAMEKFGKVEFSEYPIRLKIPTRAEISNGFLDRGEWSEIKFNDRSFDVRVALC